MLSFLKSQMPLQSCHLFPRVNVVPARLWDGFLGAGLAFPLGKFQRVFVEVAAAFMLTAPSMPVRWLNVSQHSHKLQIWSFVSDNRVNFFPQSPGQK